MEKWQGYIYVNTISNLCGCTETIPREGLLETTRPIIERTHTQNRIAYYMDYMCSPVYIYTVCTLHCLEHYSFTTAFGPGHLSHIYQLQSRNSIHNIQAENKEWEYQIKFNEQGVWPVCVARTACMAHGLVQQHLDICRRDITFTRKLIEFLPQ